MERLIIFRLHHSAQMTGSQRISSRPCFWFFGHAASVSVPRLPALFLPAKYQDWAHMSLAGLSALGSGPMPPPHARIGPRDPLPPPPCSAYQCQALGLHRLHPALHGVCTTSTQPCITGSGPKALCYLCPGLHATITFWGSTPPLLGLTCWDWAS